MVGNVEFIVVNRHSFVRAAPCKRPRKPRGAKNDPFSSVPRRSADGTRHKTGPSTTFGSIPPTTPSFFTKRQAFYMRFCFCTFQYGWEQAVKRSRWAGFVARPPPPRTKVPPRRRETPPWRLGVGWGLCFGSPPAARGPWPRALSVCLALTDTPDQGSDAGHGDDKCHK